MNFKIWFDLEKKKLCRIHEVLELITCHLQYMASLVSIGLCSDSGPNFLGVNKLGRTFAVMNYLSPCKIFISMLEMLFLEKRI